MFFPGAFDYFTEFNNTTKKYNYYFTLFSLKKIIKFSLKSAHKQNAIIIDEKNTN
jgi:hypothetical protein